MKIGIYSPYLDTAGGGEKYMMTIAEILSGKEQVEVLLDDHLVSLDIDRIKQRIKDLHGLGLSEISFIHAPLGQGSSFLKRLFFLQKYDWLFYLTDGSIFLSTAKNSVIHFQVPFDNVGTKGWWGGIKLGSWKKVIYNSYFTKELVEKSWPLKGLVVYPPVSVDLFKPLKRKKQILSVGRFFGFLKDKKQSLLIEVFKQMVDKKKLKGWSLYLAGGVGEGDWEYVEELKAQARGYEIYFYSNATLSQLQRLYGESAIYWHATGFGEKDPKKFEHFGITTVEAMAAGCVPVVINLGGQREIIEHGISGFLWDNLKDLQTLTLKVMNSDKLRISLSRKAQDKAQKFSKEKFKQQMLDLVYGK